MYANPIPVLGMGNLLCKYESLVYAWHKKNCSIENEVSKLCKHVGKTHAYVEVAKRFDKKMESSVKFPGNILEIYKQFNKNHLLMNKKYNNFPFHLFHYHYIIST